MNLDNLQRLFEGLVTPENIKEAYEEMLNGAHVEVDFDGKKFEITTEDGAHASMPMNPRNSIESFHCDCGYIGNGFCKHFVYLLSSASNIVDAPKYKEYSAPQKSTLENKIAKSKNIPQELKTDFKKFKKSFPDLWQQYQNSPSEYEARRKHHSLFNARNQLMKKCFKTARTARESNNAFGAFEILLYSLFNFCNIVGYDNDEMLRAIEFHFAPQLGTLYRQSRKPAKQAMWDCVVDLFRVKNTDRVPENPIRKILTAFILENYTSNEYLSKNLRLLEELISYALEDDNEFLAEEWAVERLWLLSETDISEDELYQEYRGWWHVSTVRLNYLEHCMITKSYLVAYTIATECLKDKKIYDDDELASLHRILLGSAYKLNKYDKTINEAKYLAEHAPFVLVYELQAFLVADETRWPKIKSKLVPIIARAKKHFRS